jgi:hypothetical protein
MDCSCEISLIITKAFEYYSFYIFIVITKEFFVSISYTIFISIYRYKIWSFWSKFIYKKYVLLLNIIVFKDKLKNYFFKLMNCNDYRILNKSYYFAGLNLERQKVGDVNLLQ